MDSKSGMSSRSSSGRRTFMKSALGAGLASAYLIGCENKKEEVSAPPPVEVSRASLIRPEILESFYEPVIIDRIEVVRVQRDKGYDFVRAYSKDGAIGIVPTNSRLKYLMPILTDLVIPFFIGKDALKIETWIDDVYRAERNYKYAGLAFWTCVAQVELVLLDMLGMIAARPVADFFGESLRKEIPVYLSTFDRKNPAEVYMDNVQQALDGTGIQAVKLKIGGRMSNNADCLPGRTEKLIPLARKILGENFTIYVDSNGSYDAQKGIEVGKLLQDYGVAFYEEPCPWQDVPATQAVADALDMPVAGGEQNSSLFQFASMINQRTVDIVQPDMHYNGGFIRALRVAKMAEQARMPITLHSPRSGPASAYMLHLATINSNLGPFQEYKPGSYAEGMYLPKIGVTSGKLTAPLGAGWGIGYDSSMWTTMKVLT